MERGHMYTKQNQIVYYIFDGESGNIISPLYSYAYNRDVKAIQMEIQKLIIEIKKKYC